MNQIDYSSFLRPHKSVQQQLRPAIPNPAVPENRAKPSPKIVEALEENAQASAALGQIRELIAGPVQRLSEARFIEVLDIMAEQGDAVKGDFNDLRDEVAKYKQATERLTTLFGTLYRKLEEFKVSAGEEQTATRRSFSESISVLRQDIENNSRDILEKIQTRVSESADMSRMDFNTLSLSLNDFVVETEGRFTRVESSTLNSLELRIAQWRAEIDDDRKKDFGEIANSFVTFGQKMLEQRTN